MATFTNSYKPPYDVKVLPEADRFGPTPYDLNFPLPIHLESLQTERVFLTPFIPSIHGKAYWDAIASNLYLYNYYPWVCQSYEEVLTFFELKIRRDTTRVMFAVIDKTRPDPAHPEFGGGSLAGVVGLFRTSASDLSTEIAHVMTFPSFQRTHVTGNACGILAKYCLDPPTASPPGLGLRRVQWYCHSENVKSATLAERLGMKREGILRWHAVTQPALREWGKITRKEDPFPDMPGRDTLCLSVCWDEWEAGGREKVQAVIDRKA
ncbi:hypothetical protein EIP91_007791 [Steccherinum ochraceum]|uniref:N-acetyltransferase domain-containing protein n=1 Tax=Steccherinum ochraceum TaxID=92696 RepID=A0A4V2MVC7_9APHY|nr:hypothetical protein EIP91_007791 [Steccherinum ochraceum]